jgi:signal peptidase I
MEKGKKPASRLRGFWRSTVMPILAILVVLTTLRDAIADWNDVPTGSMKPTILEGDRIFVNKLAYNLRVPFTHWQILQWAGPRRGDIVVFHSPTDDTLFVKRVIGVPGDRIELRDNRLLVNDQPARYEPLEAAVRLQMPAAEQARHGFANESVSGRGHAVMPRRISPDRNFSGPSWCLPDAISSWVTTAITVWILASLVSWIEG